MIKGTEYHLHNGSYRLEYDESLTQKRIEKAFLIVKEYYEHLDRLLDTVNNQLRFFGGGNNIDFEGSGVVELTESGNVSIVAVTKLYFRDLTMSMRRNLASSKVDITVEDAHGYRNLIPALYYLLKSLKVSDDDSENLVASLLALATIEEGLGHEINSNITISVQKSGKIMTGFTMTFKVIYGRMILIQKTDFAVEHVRVFADKYVKALSTIVANLVQEGKFSTEGLNALLSYYGLNRKFLTVFYYRNLINSQDVKMAMKKYRWVDTAYEVAKKGLRSVAGNPSVITGLKWPKIERIEIKNQESGEAKTGKQTKETKSGKVQLQYSTGMGKKEGTVRTQPGQQSGRVEGRSVESKKTPVIESSLLIGSDEIEREILSAGKSNGSVESKDTKPGKNEGQKAPSPVKPKKENRPERDAITTVNNKEEIEKKIIEAKKNEWSIGSVQTIKTDSMKEAKRIINEIITELRSARDNLPNDFTPSLKRVSELADEYSRLDFSGISRDEWREKYIKIGEFLSRLKSVIDEFIRTHNDNPLEVDFSKIDNVDEVSSRLEDVRKYVSDYYSIVSQLKVSGRIYEEVKVIKNTLDSIGRRMNSILRKYDKDAKSIITKVNKEKEKEKKVEKLEQKALEFINSKVESLSGAMSRAKETRVVISTKNSILKASKYKKKLSQMNENSDVIPLVDALINVLESVSKLGYPRVSPKEYSVMGVRIEDIDSEYNEFVSSLENIEKQLEPLLNDSRTKLKAEKLKDTLDEVIEVFKLPDTGRGRRRKSKTVKTVEEFVASVIDTINGLNIAPPRVVKVSNKEALAVVETEIRESETLISKVRKSKIKNKDEIVNTLNNLVKSLEETKRIIEEINNLPVARSITDVETFNKTNEKVSDLIRRAESLPFSKPILSALEKYKRTLEDNTPRETIDYVEALGKVAVSVPVGSCDFCPKAKSIVDEAMKNKHRLSKEEIAVVEAVADVIRLFDNYPVVKIVKGNVRDKKRFNNLLNKVVQSKNILPGNFAEAVSEYVKRIGSNNVQEVESKNKVISLRTKLASVRLKIPVAPVSYDDVKEKIKSIESEFEKIDNIDNNTSFNISGNIYVLKRLIELFEKYPLTTPDNARRGLEELTRIQKSAQEQGIQLMRNIKRAMNGYSSITKKIIDGSKVEEGKATEETSISASQTEKNTEDNVTATDKEVVSNEIVSRFEVALREIEKKFDDALERLTPEMFYNLMKESLSAVASTLSSLSTRYSAIIGELEKYGWSGENKLDYMLRTVNELDNVIKVVKEAKEGGIRPLNSIEITIRTQEKVYSGKKISNESTLENTMRKILNVEIELDALKEVLEKAVGLVETNEVRSKLEEAIKTVDEKIGKVEAIRQKVVDNADVPEKDEIVSNFEGYVEEKKESKFGALFNRLSEFISTIVSTIVSDGDEEPINIKIDVPVEKYPSKAVELVKRPDYIKMLLDLNTREKEYVFVADNLLKSYEENTENPKNIERERATVNVAKRFVVTVQDLIDDGYEEPRKIIDNISKLAGLLKSDPRKLKVLLGDSILEETEDTLDDYIRTLEEIISSLNEVEDFAKSNSVNPNIVSLPAIKKIITNSIKLAENVRKRIDDALNTKINPVPREEFEPEVKLPKNLKIIESQVSKIEKTVNKGVKKLEETAEKMEDKLTIDVPKELESIEIESSDVVNKLKMGNSVSKIKNIAYGIRARINEYNSVARKVPSELKQKGTVDDKNKEQMLRLLDKIISGVAVLDEASKNIGKEVEERAKEYYEKTKEKKVKELEKKSKEGKAIGTTLRKLLVSGEEVHYDAFLEDVARIVEAGMKVKGEALKLKKKIKEL